MNFNNYLNFFGVNGYTSTSANYLANKAKEIERTILENNNISFINRTVTSIGGNSKNLIISTGLTNSDITELKEKLILKSKLNAVISWFREAIKAKEAQLRVIERTTFDKWMKAKYPDVDTRTFNAELEDVPEITVSNDFSEDTYINQNMSIKDVNEYLYLLAACSTIGKFIHPDSPYSKAREEGYKKDNTHTVQDYAASTTVYNYALSADKSTIENTFFDLQETHREYQKRLNAIKYNIEQGIQKLKDAYQKEVDKRDLVEASNQVKINEARQRYLTEYNNERIDMANEIRSLKIIVPNDLTDIIDYINNYKS